MPASPAAWLRPFSLRARRVGGGRTGHDQTRSNERCNRPRQHRTKERGIQALPYAADTTIAQAVGWRPRRSGRRVEPPGHGLGSGHLLCPKQRNYGTLYPRQQNQGKHHRERQPQECMNPEGRLGTPALDQEDQRHHDVTDDEDGEIGGCVVRAIGLEAPTRRPRNGPSSSGRSRTAGPLLQRGHWPCQPRSRAVQKSTGA